MTVAIWQTSSGFSFSRPPGHSESLTIEAPDGSELLPTPGLRGQARLFVPAGRLVRLGHDAADVVRGLRAGRFRVA